MKTEWCMTAPEFETMLERCARIGYEETLLGKGIPPDVEMAFEQQPQVVIDDWRRIAGAVLGVAASHDAIRPDVRPLLLAAVAKTRS